MGRRVSSLLRNWIKRRGQTLKIYMTNPRGTPEAVTASGVPYKAINAYSARACYGLKLPVIVV